MKTRQLHALGAAVLLLASAALAWVGQPDPMQKWLYLAPKLEPRLSRQEVLIEPAELMELMHNDYLDLELIDVRSERDWNLFHLWGAQRIPAAALPAQHERFSQLPQNGVIVLMSNDEAGAIEGWKILMATASQPNAYILAGGINRWLAEFDPQHHGTEPATGMPPDDTLRHPLPWALGSRHPAAMPDPHNTETHDFARKVRLQKRVVKKGGCG